MDRGTALVILAAAVLLGLGRLLDSFLWIRHEQSMEASEMARLRIEKATERGAAIAQTRTEREEAPVPVHPAPEPA